MPGGAGQQPGGRHSGGQLLRRVCGDIGAHPGRGRLGGGFPDQKPRRRAGSHWRLYCRTAGFGGGGRHAAVHPRYRKGVRLHLWGQPQPLSRAFPCPPYHGPGSQDGGVCRPDDGAAGLPDGAHLRYGTPRHHSDDSFWRAGAPQKILQRHPVRRSGGLLRDTGALGHAGL